MSKLRYLVGMTASAVITVGLFLFMMMLVTKDFVNPPEVDDGEPIVVTRDYEGEKPPQTRDRIKKEHFMRDAPPPAPPVMKTVLTEVPSGDGLAIGPMDPFELDGREMGTPETPYAKAKIMFPPTFPERCRQRGIEGQVVVQFDVTAIGSVENPRILSSDNSCFDRESLKAIKRWKFDPKIVNGKAVPQYGVQEVIIYEFEDEA